MQQKRARLYVTAERHKAMKKAAELVGMKIEPVTDEALSVWLTICSVEGGALLHRLKAAAAHEGMSLASLVCRRLNGNV